VTERPRQPEGTPIGGQWAAKGHAEADVELAAGEQWQQCARHGTVFPLSQYQEHCDEFHDGKQIAVRDVDPPDPRAYLLKVLDELDEPLAPGCDREELIANVKPGDYLLVESSTRGGGAFLTLHDSADDAASYNVDQEYPDDWEFVEVVALNNGARFAQHTTASAAAAPVAPVALGGAPTPEQIGAMRSEAFDRFRSAANDLSDAAGRAAAATIVETFPGATHLMVDTTRDGRDVDVAIMAVCDAEGTIAGHGISRAGWTNGHGNTAADEFDQLESEVGPDLNDAVTYAAMGTDYRLRDVKRIDIGAGGRLHLVLPDDDAAPGQR
jgi:hypothetical protein